jgi:Zn-dependent M28 family amino/carboxypeptidase
MRQSAALVLSVFLALAALRPAAALTIGDLVAQVSQSDIQAHIAALEGERATPAQQAAAAAYITSELESYGYTVTSDPVGTSENLIASMPGTATPDQTFVIGAHFDGVPGSPAADDNASGVAGMLEIARVVAGSPFQSSIEFVAFGLEELGLVGSTQYAQAASGAGRDLIGMIALDMIGYTCDTPGCQVPIVDIPPCLDVDPEGVDVGTYIAVAANEASAGLLGGFQMSAAAYVPSLEVGAGVVAGDGSCFPGSRGSDHAPFWDEGYAAIMLTDTASYRNPNYHQASDTLATLDLGFATDVTRAAVATVAVSAVLVPEPTTVLLVAFGLAALALSRRRRRM